MYPWMYFCLGILGLIVLFKVIEQITYTICWLKSDKETRAKFLKSDDKTIPNIRKDK